MNGEEEPSTTKDDDDKVEKPSTRRVDKEEPSTTKGKKGILEEPSTTKDKDKLEKEPSTTKGKLEEPKDNEKNCSSVDFYSILEILDDVEREVESFKKKALSLVSEQSSLESTLGLIISDFAARDGVDSEEVVVKAMRLSQRLSSAARITIEVPRDSSQKEALRKAEEGFLSPESFAGLSTEELRRLLNSTSGIDPSNQKFEGIFHACSVDDQKFIKAKLERKLKELLKN